MTTFGVVLIAEGATRKEWLGRCRRAESLGFDVIAVPDHLNLLSPFPTAVLAAEATERPTIGTYVLNASFHRPALLARDVTTTAGLLGDRLELGLGTGYVRAEFAAAGLPFDAATRVARLAELVGALERLPVRPPLLIGGHGDRVLGLAARHADTISFTGAPYRPEYGRTALVTAGALLERVAYARAAAGGRAGAGGRAARPRLNVLSKATVLTGDRRAGVESLRRYAPDLTTEELLEVPTLHVGTPAQIAEQIRMDEERFGFSYVTVMDSAMDDFGKVIERLR
ncbi:TIGR03621 family F420-dependent LLM class oxidoreductase [Nonomuraea sp. NPDC050783]|uniref:TIGR03621 family F420-dependent LLM class oxidoreductase n=1 Tax=Nonomuraea sp. NPDC050783 TaxID=3154634 RepID=UPI003465983A